MQKTTTSNFDDPTPELPRGQSASANVRVLAAGQLQTGARRLRVWQSHRKILTRRGTSLVEFALVLPLFFLFVFALLEFGHAMMVMNTLTSVSKEAALLGSFDGSSTASVQQLVNTRLAAVLHGATPTVSVKDASSFELSTTNAGSIDIGSLPSLELNNAESRHLFIVHIEVPYDSVALLPTMWIRGVTLRGDSVMRRE